ncbi:type III-A CRISPR-associated protein Csm2 [Anaeromassilibacillus senegalensis]|uniref:type III-A CRISPR-associated protein Csm2 n=1 Tax=Anaeromassilibacillus senegalensis TaxID=1673717 RepID=UPI0006822E54|nr:type III-A CRISPR-associated protein Csm2 [Anaeromassilibacillus senegalensis]
MERDWREVLGQEYDIPLKQTEQEQKRKGGKDDMKDNEKENINKPEYLIDDRDYVKMADEKMKSYARSEDQKNLRPIIDYHKLTTSQMRNLYALITRVYNKMRAGQNIAVSDLTNVKVRMVYDAGRNSDVAKFLLKTELLTGLNWLTENLDAEGKINKELFTRYANYMEALVAYHYYYSKSKD